MKPKAKSAVVVALTACCSSCSAAAALAGEGEDDPTTLSSSLQSQESISINGREIIVEKEHALNHQSNTDRRISRHMTDTSSVNYAPGCGQSTGTNHSIYLGCYDDQQDDRAFPFQVPSNGHGSLDCERECTTRGYRYFGRQFKGQCFCGSNFSQIVRHGIESDCNCCGENVGGGRNCVWENTKHPESQQAEESLVPATAPVLKPNSHLFADSVHVGSLSFGSPTNLFEESEEEPEQQSAAQVQDPSSDSLIKPTGPFRLRLYWQPGYNWQDSSSEKWWCAECGSCGSGSRLQIRKCSQTNRQKWVAVDKTIRFAPNPSLCVTVSGVGSSNPIRLRPCNGGQNQQFNGVQEEGRFELQPSFNPGRCISQHHHPKDKENLYPETCSKTRSTKTTYWQCY